MQGWRLSAGSPALQSKTFQRRPAQATAPFRNYFQVICIPGFIRTGIGSPLGDAV
jgi:hypothetical protein